MLRRCIICGQEPGDQCVYPRNMAEARRWQNLANLGSFDVDTESLCRHGCVCASHLDVQESSSALESSSDGAGEARTSAGLQESSVKWSSSGSKSGSGPSYPTDSKVIRDRQNQSKQSFSSGWQEIKSEKTCKNGSCRFRNACNNMFQGNQHRIQNQANSQQPDSTSSRGRNLPLKLNPMLIQLPHGTTICSRAYCPGLRSTDTTRVGCLCQSCPLKKNNSPEDRSCIKCPGLRYSGSQESIQKAQKKEMSKDRPQIPISSERPSGPSAKKHRLEESKTKGDDFHSSNNNFNRPPSPTWRSNDIIMKLNNWKKKPELKSQCCQACINCQLRDQEVQCSKVALPTRSSSHVGKPKLFGSLSQRTASSATDFTATYSKNSEYGSERKNSNAINVLLMNGTRSNDYDDPCCCPTRLRSMAPPPEICVKESDLTECNERANFPEIDKPNYRVCRSSNETNVLVLEEGPMDRCSPKTTEDSETTTAGTQNQNEGQINPNQNHRDEQQNDFVTNWLDCPVANNFTKVLELQRVRIKELENLLHQHNVLQQTIQHKVAELQCTDTPVSKGDTKK
ncbi:uncharacterized protein LOC108105639 [Drosophila eugracilis]|uniref:uncharacterized protein LOC108105639 n=1 Tax=Drosophila eugracilis TaxID=29029 RepID=UPI0007E6B76C|nr:uncharacterized protein LOC108105639 [Drosophila eugracilis]